MKPIPTAEEFLKPYQDDLVLGRIVLHKAMIEFAKLHVEAALKEALEEVPYGGSDEVRYEDVVGILTCYPLTNIK